MKCFFFHKDVKVFISIIHFFPSLFIQPHKINREKFSLFFLSFFLSSKWYIKFTYFSFFSFIKIFLSIFYLLLFLSNSTFKWSDAQNFWPKIHVYFLVLMLLLPSQFVCCNEIQEQRILEEFVIHWNWLTCDTSWVISIYSINQNVSLVSYKRKQNRSCWCVQLIINNSTLLTNA